MALRNQPYIPLYVQDFMTDEKLLECSAESTGVYIRLMCLMHKSEEYGTILLKQKDKQTPKQIYNFALKVAKSMPYNVDVINTSLEELINEGVLVVNEDYLIQKRMVKDFDISLKRSSSGSKGGSKTQEIVKSFAKAKYKANSEYEYETEINNKERSEFLNFRKSELEQLRNDIFEKLKKYGLTEPIIYIGKKVPIEYYDLVEFVIECIDNEEWKLNLKTRFGNTKFELAMKDFINKIKTDMEYLTYENTSDFQRHFSNWLNKNYDKYGK